MGQTDEDPSQATFKRETADFDYEGNQFQKDKSRAQSVNPTSSPGCLKEDAERY